MSGATAMNVLVWFMSRLKTSCILAVTRDAPLSRAVGSIVRIPSRTTGPQVMLDSFHDGLRRNRSFCTAFQVKPGSDLIDPVEDPTSFRAFLMIQLVGQVGQVHARRRPSRNHLNPAFIPILHLNAATLENNQSGTASPVVEGKRVTGGQPLVCKSMHAAGHQIFRHANDG